MNVAADFDAAGSSRQYAEVVDADVVAKVDALRAVDGGFVGNADVVTQGGKALSFQFGAA
jgi:hypothetical protein